MVVIKFSHYTTSLGRSGRQTPTSLSSTKQHKTPKTPKVPYCADGTAALSTTPQQVEERGFKPGAALWQPPPHTGPWAVAAGTPAQGLPSGPPQPPPGPGRAGRARTLLPGLGSRSRPADVTAAATRPRQAPALGPPPPATGPASPRPGKARPPPYTDGLGPSPTGLSRRSGARRRCPPQPHRVTVPPPIRNPLTPRQRDAAPHPGNGTGTVLRSAAPEAELAPTGSGRRWWGAGSTRRMQPPGCARVSRSAGGSAVVAVWGGWRRRAWLLAGTVIPERGSGGGSSPCGRCSPRRVRFPVTEPCGGGRGDPACSCTGQAVRRGRAFAFLNENSVARLRRAPRGCFSRLHAGNGGFVR